MAWLGTISRSDADGEVAETYAMRAARARPDMYLPPHGDAPRSSERIASTRS